MTGAEREPGGPRLTRRFLEALTWAAELHAEQRRHNSDAPYLSHLMTTASLVLEDGHDEDVAIAALLHDAIEDQDADPAEIGRRFGRRVADLVLACTDTTEDREQMAWGTRKRVHLERMETSDLDALGLFAADKVASLQALTDDVDREGWGLFRHSARTPEELVGNYEMVLAVLCRRGVPGAAPVRLQHLVESFRARCRAQSAVESPENQGSSAAAPG